MQRPLSHAEQVMKESSDTLWRVQLYRFQGPVYGQWIDHVSTIAGCCAGSFAKPAGG